MNEELLDAAADGVLAIASFPIPAADKRELMKAFIAHVCAGQSLITMRQMMREMQYDDQATRH